MDGVLFWILLLVFYFVLQGLGSRRSKEAPEETKKRRSQTQGETRTPPAQHQQQPTQPNRDLDSALGEIRDLLGGPEQTRTQEQTGTSMPSERRQRAPRQRQRERPKRTPPNREKRQTGRARPTGRLGGQEAAEKMSSQQAEMEEMAEKMRRGGSVRDALKIEHLNLPTEEEMRRQDKTGPGRDMRDRLRDAGSAREAVLISEVLGPPRSRHSNLKRLNLLKR